MSSHGYLKPGQWVQLTQEFIDWRSAPEKGVYKVPKGTFLRFEGRLGNMLVLTNNKITIRDYRSNIKFNAISPSKSSTLEALYGSSESNLPKGRNGR